MRVPRLLSSLCCLMLLHAANAATTRIGPHTFTHPDGFTVELVAGPPLVDRPISMDFDDLGRLYVADSSGSNENVQKQLQEKPHRIVRLEDSDGDGRFDKSTLFADKMMFPEGAMWLDGSLYVSAPPSIWKLTDGNNDGIADYREEWFQGKTLTGCANDLHGPFLGPDGWIYWCKGAFAEQKHERPGQTPFVTRAAHIFRARPNGSGLEPVMTGGMDNPVEVAFTREGERIFTTTFFQHPEAGRRDGLVHAIYGGVYGKIHDVIDDHPRTGDVMPVLVHMGPAAPSGITRYESSIFGAEYQDNLFATSFNLHKVTRHQLKWNGATYDSENSDFLLSDNPDFHPTDVIEDADGSLLVIDTGGWYKICCPTSQLAKSDVLGGIYRIRKSGATTPKDPRGLTIPWDLLLPPALTHLLADERPAVQQKTINRLVKFGPKSLGALETIAYSSPSALAKRNALWALARINHPDAWVIFHRSLEADDLSVAHTAAQAISLWRDKSALEPLLKALTNSSPHLRRIVAEALGRIGEKRAVPALLTAAAVASDRALEHSIIFALIEIGDREETLKGLENENPLVKKTAAIALDQMKNGALPPATVIQLLGSENQNLREAALWIAGRHPEWGNELRSYFEKRLSGNPDQSQLVALQNELLKFIRSESIQSLVATTASSPQIPGIIRQLAFKIMARSGLKETPQSWTDALELGLKSDDAELLRESLACARVLGSHQRTIQKISPKLKAIAHDQQRSVEFRLLALAALPEPGSLDAGLLKLLKENLSPSTSVALRNLAATVLGKVRFTSEEAVEAAALLEVAGPLEIGRILSAYEMATNDLAGAKIVSALLKSPAASALRPDQAMTFFSRFSEPVKNSAEPLLKALQQDSASQAAEIDRLLPLLQEGDIRRGQKIFSSSKAACSSCHALGYLGGRVGPDLTSIGTVRTERDLLESILYPSASFVRSYEPVLAITKDGEEHSGVLRKDSPDEVILSTGTETEIRLARSEIQEMRPGKVSVMPGGLGDQLTKEELADLLAFLKATKWGAN
ncbi:MAG: HEAT repeat domain-containing protein [Verrucomicrobiota bacterium]|nr:HEAT repeat domain-containing protein [Verrucomicrobiota bacterium]